jgi:hypothetical protein
MKYAAPSQRGAPDKVKTRTGGGRGHGGEHYAGVGAGKEHGGRGQREVKLAKVSGRYKESHAAASHFWHFYLYDKKCLLSSPLSLAAACSAVKSLCASAISSYLFFIYKISQTNRQA